MEELPKAKSIRDLVTSYMRDCQPIKGEIYADINRGWQSMVGVDLAAHSVPIDVTDRVLVVEVDHPAWMNMLQIKRDTVIAELQKRMPELKIETLQLQLRK